MSKKTSLLCLVAVAVVAALVVRADAGEPTGSARPLKCVYFSPSDCEPNPDRAERLYRVMAYVQEFYRSEMERNGFGDSTTFGLETTEPGKLKLYEVNAPGKLEDYGRESFWEVRKICGEELAKQGIDVNKEVVAIFQQGLKWEDGKATEVGSFVGMGTSFYGAGTFYDDPMLDPEKLSSKEPGGYYHRPCSIGEFNSHYIGGIAHELGHALTLPHDCELATENRELGSALMGGGNHVFGRELRGEGKGAFLTYSEALRLSVVPAISGREPQRRDDAISLVDLTPRRLSESAVKFVGKLEAKVMPLALIFYEDRDARASDYDAKTWTVQPKEDGAFELDLTEVAPEPSELRVAAVSDVGTTMLFRVSYNPNGKEGEFDPITRKFDLDRVSRALEKGDFAALDKLAETRFKNNAEFRTLCQDLTSAKAAPVSPAAVPEEYKEFRLSNAQFDSEKVGWSRLTRGVFFTGSLLQLEGRGYANGICAHAPSSVTTTLDGKWRTLKFAYGLQDGGTGSVVFVVKGDGKELFRSALVKDHVRRDAEIDVDGVKTLELITEDGGDDNRSDHSIWIEPKLTR